MTVHPRLADAVTQLHDGILVTDIQGNIEYANAAIESITSYTPEELIGQNVRIFRSGHHPQEFYDEMWTTILRGDVWSGRVVNVKKNGEIYHEHLTIIPLFDDAGTLTHLAGEFRNIEQEVEAERELQELQHRARHKSETQLYLLKDISHKIRTTLNSILGFVELLADDIGKEKRDYLSVIVNNGKNLLISVDDVLLITRIQAGETPLMMKETSLADEISKVVIESMRSLEASRCKIHTIFGDHGTKVPIDSGRFMQALHDILINAAKQSRKGNITVATDNDGETGVRIVVADSEAWSNKQLHHTISAEFEYPDEDNWHVFDESGINTIVTKGLIELMGGSISVLTSPDFGNVFLLRFPAQQK